MTRRRLFQCSALLLAAGFVCGCVTSGAAASDRAQIDTLLAQWKTAFIANDLGAILPLYSEHFQAKGKGRDFLREYLQETMKESADADARINLDVVSIVMDGDKAVVAPVPVCGRTGSDTLRLDLVKEDGHWRIVGMSGKHL